MPKYVIGNGEFEKTPLFSNVHHMAHFLTRTSIDDDHWKRGFVNTANKYLNGELTPNVELRRDALKRVVTRHPYQLSGDILLDFIHQDEANTEKGSGIAEAINTIANTALNISGLPKLKEIIFGKAPHKEITDEQKLFARALKDTYKPEGERSRNIGKLQRLSQYDTDRYSIWDEGNGQVLVTIHGTKINLPDLKSDAGILVGRTDIKDQSVTDLFKLLDSNDIHYDVAAHSLGTEFVINGLGKDDNADKIMLFNPASSGLQDSSVLKERANNTKYDYLINPSDPISHGIYQQMSNDKVKDSVISAYKWNPLTAHSMDQWVDESSDITEDMGSKKESESLS